MKLSKLVIIGGKSVGTTKLNTFTLQHCKLKNKPLAQKHQGPKSQQLFNLSVNS
jgi:hypothetical protein